MRKPPFSGKSTSYDNRLGCDTKNLSKVKERFQGVYGNGFNVPKLDPLSFLPRNMRIFQYKKVGSFIEEVQ